jgi:phosphinothricin acetyltransferase
MNNNIIIRKATIDDVKSINEIVNDAIKNSYSNWSYTERTLDKAIEWFYFHNSKEYCIFVSTQNDVITGYGSLSPLREKDGYWPVAENSVYVHKDYRGKKIGSALLKSLIRAAKDSRLRVISAWIDSENILSIKMHEKFGFCIAGELKSIGEKFGRKRSLTIMQLDLEE